MNAQDLRNSILQLAVQGKLAEQRPEEGTAKELLAQIKAEKERLIEEKKIKKEQTLPEIAEDEIPFEIPESWKWVRLGNILSIESGKGLTAKQMIKGTIPVYGGNGITGYHNQSLVHKETVVIGRVGFYCGSVHVTQKEAWITDNAFIVTYPENTINKKYLAYVLEHIKLGKDNNATAQPVVSGKKIYPLLFPIPPLAEQERIAAKIEEILPYIEQYGKAHAKLEIFSKKFPEDMKKSILQLAMQGKLVEQRPKEGTADELCGQIAAEKARLVKEGKIKAEKPLPEIGEEEIPFEIPKSWKWVRLGKIGILTRGSGIKRTETLEDGYPCIRYGELYTTYKTMFSNTVSFVTKELYDKSQKIAKDDVVMALTGENKTDIAMAAAYKGEMPIAMGSDMACWSHHMMEPLYLVYLMNSPYAISCKRKLATGDIIIHISNDKLANMLIPVPPLAEQKRIVAKIREVLPCCNQLVQRIINN